MGSTSWQRDTWKSVKQELDDYYGRSVDGTNHIVKSITKGGAYYAVCRSFNPEHEGACFAIAAPYETWVEDGYPYILAKDQDESCGPYQHDFPVRWLEDLGEPINEWSREWRDRVRAYAKEKKPVLKDGDRITFKEPVTFVNGEKHDTFEVFKCGRGGRMKRYKAIDEYGHAYGWYRLGNNVLKNREWEVVK